MGSVKKEASSSGLFSRFVVDMERNHTCEDGIRDNDVTEQRRKTALRAVMAAHDIDYRKNDILWSNRSSASSRVVGNSWVPVRYLLWAFDVDLLLTKKNYTGTTRTAAT
jgi:hypothetical protein